MFPENGAAVGRQAFDSRWIVRAHMAGMIIDDNAVDEHLIKVVCGNNRRRRIHDEYCTVRIDRQGDHSGHLCQDV